MPIYRFSQIHAAHIFGEYIVCLVLLLLFLVSLCDIFISQYKQKLKQIKQVQQQIYAHVHFELILPLYICTFDGYSLYPLFHIQVRLLLLSIC